MDKTYLLFIEGTQILVVLRELFLALEFIRIEKVKKRPEKYR